MHQLITHVLLVMDHGILILKRTAMERGRSNVYPEFWDLPGGLAQPTELPVTLLFGSALKRPAYTSRWMILSVKIPPTIPSSKWCSPV
ncbi:NUDIX hydrolase [Lactiplantibacillus carotarum]|uniref:hypothetical protein n=1 Tax=Lactiplantibacillus carotarum TaxID=2993456 RepID=UPI00298EEB61|nr:hypothetical protein [Lactiplantibacillus carotarum]